MTWFLLLTLILIGSFLLFSSLVAADGKTLCAHYGLPRSAVMAHRGASYWAPEGTRPSYLLAKALGADYLELDLQRTKDGALIVFHDNTLERTTDVAKVFPGREKETVDRFTWAELERLDAGSWFNLTRPARARKSFAGTRILELEEVLSIAGKPGKGPGLYIETKAASRFPGIERQLVDFLKKKGWILEDGSPAAPGCLVLQSFEEGSLRTLKDLAPKVPLVYLVDREMAEKEGWDSLARTAKDLGAGLGTYTAWVSWKAHHKGLILHQWTVNDAWKMRLGLALGADGLFTDRPEVMLRLVGRRPGTTVEEALRKLGY